MNLGLYPSDAGRPYVAQWNISPFTYSQVGFIYVKFSVSDENSVEATISMYNNLQDWVVGSNPVLVQNLGKLTVNLNSTTLLSDVISSVQGVILNSYSIETIKA